MSSILRALKKLDQDAQQQQGGPDAQQQTIRQSLQRKKHASRFMKPLFVIVPMVVLLAIAILLIPGNPKESDVKGVKKEQVVTTTSPQTQAKVPPSEPKPRKQLPAQTRKVPVKTMPQPALQTPGNSRQEAFDQHRQERPKDESPLPQSPKATDDTGPASPQKTYRKGFEVLNPGNRRIITPGRNLPSGRPVPSTSSPRNQITPPPTASPQAANHPQFSLDGILWSENPKRRVALIGDKYVKEGEELQGVTILKIEKKAVILRQGDAQWTIRLKK